MALACRICIARNGLRGRDIANLPKNEDELVEHMERVHHMPVIREGETKAEATARFLKQYPEARNCNECRDAGAEW